jgi:transcriptional repressor NrdR
MRCPYCGSEDSQVKDSRPAEDGAAIRRRRVCPDCGGRFTTFERVQLRDLQVLKKTGRRVPFDRDKLAKSFQIALRKRPVDPERIDRAVSGIVRRLESSGETEIATDGIGLLVLEALKALDDVGFVRYASVYRDFSGPQDFRAYHCRTDGTDRRRQHRWRRLRSWSARRLTGGSWRRQSVWPAGIRAGPGRIRPLPR